MYVERFYLSWNRDDEEIESCKYFADAFYALETTNTKARMRGEHMFKKQKVMVAES